MSLDWKNEDLIRTSFTCQACRHNSQLTEQCCSACDIRWPFFKAWTALVIRETSDSGGHQHLAGWKFCITTRPVGHKSEWSAECRWFVGPEWSWPLLAALWWTALLCHCPFRCQVCPAALALHRAGWARLCRKSLWKPLCRVALAWTTPASCHSAAPGTAALLVMLCGGNSF